MYIDRPPPFHFAVLIIISGIFLVGKLINKCRHIATLPGCVTTNHLAKCQTKHSHVALAPSPGGNVNLWDIYQDHGLQQSHENAHWLLQPTDGSSQNCTGCS
jgi:hypothetical protein